MICKKCKKEIDKLEVFPGNICLACYKRDFKMPTNPEEINKLFINSLNIKK